MQYRTEERVRCKSMPENIEEYFEWSLKLEETTKVNIVCLLAKNSRCW